MILFPFCFILIQKWEMLLILENIEKLIFIKSKKGIDTQKNVIKWKK